MGVNDNKTRELTDAMHDQEHQITEATTLKPYQRRVLATIPLASANAYAITLPHLSEVPNGAVFLIRFVRASGSYVDGTVTVQDQDEPVLGTDYAQTAFANANDYVVLMAVGHMKWVVLEDIVAGS